MRPYVVTLEPATRALSCVLLLASCTAELGSTDRDLGHEADQVSVGVGVIGRDYSRIDDYLESPPLHPTDGASRVGVLATLVGDVPAPSFEARPVDASGSPTGPWVELEVTFAEAENLVAVVDFGTVDAGAQLRIPVAAVDRVVHLTWSAVVPADEADPVDEDAVSGAREALRSELRTLGVVPREDWGARSTRCRARDSSRRRLAIHYTVTPSSSPASRVRAVQRYHQDSRGWCDVGYHFLVGMDGRIYEGRPLDLRGAHVLNHNAGNVGIALVGCFHPSGCSGMGPTTPSDAMIRAAGRIAGELASLYAIDVNSSTLKGHRDHAGASTSCPGDHVYARLDDIRMLARTGDAPPPSETPPAETAPPPVEPPPGPVPAACAAVSGCGACDATPGCAHCASTGSCGSESDGSCAWGGDIGGVRCADAFWPCWAASCWNPHVTLRACDRWAEDENFGSGRFSVHRYWTTIPAGGPLTIRLERVAGSFEPALFVTDRAGALIHAGDVAALHPDVRVSAASSGRADTAASVTLETPTSRDVLVYVTGWEIVDAAFAGRLPRDVRYRLSTDQACR